MIEGCEHFGLAPKTREASIRAGCSVIVRYRAIAGRDYEKAVIPEDRLPLLSRHDARAAHYEVVSTSEPP
jgi:hypothetical protein